MKNIHVIVNPAAGNHRAEKKASVITGILSRQGYNLSVFHTGYPGHGTLISRESVKNNADCVLSVGGDGTAYEVVQGLMDSVVPLGIIPAGTGNDFIKTLKLPSDSVKCLEHIMKSTPKSVDMGKINDEIFMNVCGVGFDVSVLEYSLKAKKYLRGMLPYLWGVIRTIINYRSSFITLEVDGKEILSSEVLVCCVANGKYIGGGMAVSPSSEIDDGFLDVIVIKNVSRYKMIKYLPGLLKGKILEFEDCISFRCKNASLSSERPMKINVDGEIKTYNKADFSINENAVKICY